MVLEQIYSVETLRDKPIYTFLLGITYALIGLGAALFMFPEDPALVAVAFCTVFLVYFMIAYFSCVPTPRYLICTSLIPLEKVVMSFKGYEYQINLDQNGRKRPKRFRNYISLIDG